MVASANNFYIDFFRTSFKHVFSYYEKLHNVYIIVLIFILIVKAAVTSPLVPLVWFAFIPFEQMVAGWCAR